MEAGLTQFWQEATKLIVCEESYEEGIGNYGGVPATLVVQPSGAGTHG